MILGLGISIEESSHERDQRDALELGPALSLGRILCRPDHGVEPMGVPQRLGSQGGDHLAEAHIALGERRGVPLRAEKNRADDRTAPSNGRDDDRADVAQIEVLTNVPQHRLVTRIGDEHGLAGLEGTLELGITGEIDHDVADRGIFVARDEPDVRGFAGEENGAAVEPERFTELARDGLQDVAEVQRPRDLLEDIDQCDQMVTFAP